MARSEIFPQSSILTAKNIESNKIVDTQPLVTQNRELLLAKLTELRQRFIALQSDLSTELLTES